VTVAIVRHRNTLTYLLTYLFISTGDVTGLQMARYNG